MINRWGAWILCSLPVLALACGDWPQDSNLLYPAAFRVNVAQNCAGREPSVRTQCLQEVMSDSLIAHPDTPALLPLIRNSRLRDLQACTPDELQEIRQAGGQSASLWVCMTLLHSPQNPQNPQSTRPVRGVAVAVAVDNWETEGAPGQRAAVAKITQMVTLPLAQ